MDPSNLDRFREEFWHDLDRSQLKPVEEYVSKYPDCAAEIEKAYEHSRATGGPPTAPHYGPIQRMRILKLKAARGWSSSQVAQVFAITEETIASWLKRVDEAVAAGSTFLVSGRPIHAAPDPLAAALSIGASF